MGTRVVRENILEEAPILVDEKREARPGSGSLLAAARKKQKRTVDEIAEQLNLSSSQIRSIELDQSEGLPEPTYVRGYIRSYANLLGLDAKEILGHYLNPNWQKGSSLDEMPRGIEVHDHDDGGWLTPSRLVGLIVLLGIAGFLAYSGYINFDALKSSTSDTQISQLTDTDTDSDSVEGASQDPVSQQAGSELQASQQQVSGQGSEDVVEEQLAATTDANSEATSDDYQLELRFTDTCWVDVRDENDEKLAYKSYVKGEVLSLTSALPMSVFVGNVSAVSARVGGVDFDLAPYQEGVFARFSVPVQ